MKKQHNQLQRIMYFIKELRKDKFPNSKSFVEVLRKYDEQNDSNYCCSSKTVLRDIDYLKNELNAPIDFDTAENGFYLWNKQWSLPEIVLGREEIFAELFTKKISANNLLPCLKEHLNAGTDIQLATGQLDKISLSALNSVIHATGNIIAIDHEVSQKLLQTWKSCHTADVEYAKSKSDEAEQRLIDIHGLFLSNSVWYCRAYCHSRQGFRSFALHKFTSIKVTNKKFKRSSQVVEALKSGQLFDLPTFPEAKILCRADTAEYIQDREWFEGQEIVTLADGSVELTFKNVPQNALRWWVMSFSGKLKVLSPASLVKDVTEAATEILAIHEQ